MPAAASFSRASRCWARYCSVLSNAARPTPFTSPESPLRGHISMLQECSRFSAGAPAQLS